VLDSPCVAGVAPHRGSLPARLALVDMNASAVVKCVAAHTAVVRLADRHGSCSL